MNTLSLQTSGVGVSSNAGSSLHSTQNSQHVEAQLRIKFSGGEALAEGFCRQCAVSFNLELLPSTMITGWDVLPAEMYISNLNSHLRLVY